MIKSETDTLWTAAPLNHGSLDRQAQRPSGEPGQGAHHLRRKAPGHVTWLRRQSHARWPPLQAWERPKGQRTLVLSAFPTTSSLSCQ